MTEKVDRICYNCQQWQPEQGTGPVGIPLYGECLAAKRFQADGAEISVSVKKIASQPCNEYGKDGMLKFEPRDEDQ